MALFSPLNECSFSVPTFPPPPSSSSCSASIALKLCSGSHVRRTKALAVAVASYKVLLQTPDGDRLIQCPDDRYLLEASEDAGIELPSSCLSGVCSTCVGKIVKGQVDQSDGAFLSDKQKDQGFVLTCIAYPLSDLVIQTHAQDLLI